MNKFKVGDKVRIRKDLKHDTRYNDIRFNDYNMGKYKGKIATINCVHSNYYDIDIDDRIYGWSDGMLEPIQEVIEYQNKKYNIAIIEKNYNSPFVGKDCLRLTLKEHKEEILDDKEKEYLRNVIKYVIKPTHNEVDKIFKSIYGNSYYIRIALKNGEYLLLPNFNDTRMYKMMKLGEPYTLEQLGL